MPNDFAFSLNYGINGKNKIDTFSGVIVKDLITAGEAQAPFEFTEQEKLRIYNKMKEVQILGLGKLSNDSCTVEPSKEDIWRIRIMGEEITYQWSGEECAATEDGMDMIELRNYIVDVVESSEVYKKLPERVGAYE